MVFLTRERGYKLKRGEDSPTWISSTAERRGAMCAAEIEINHRLAPEIYLGTAPKSRRDGKLSPREVSEHADDAVDWLVVMRRFDEDGLFDRMADRHASRPR